MKKTIALLVVINLLFAVFSYYTESVWFSVSCLLVCLGSLFAIFYLICRNCDVFSNTDTHQIVFPKAQCVISCSFLMVSIVFFSKATRYLFGVLNTKYDAVCYASIIVAGWLLFISTRMKKILFVQLMIFLAVLFYIPALIFSMHIFIDIVLTIVGLYTMIQGVMTDKRIVRRLKLFLTNLK